MRRVCVRVILVLSTTREALMPMLHRPWPMLLALRDVQRVYLLAPPAMKEAHPEDQQQDTLLPLERRDIVGSMYRALFPNDGNNTYPVIQSPGLRIVFAGEHTNEKLALAVDLCQLFIVLRCMRFATALRRACLQLACDWKEVGDAVTTTQVYVQRNSAAERLWGICRMVSRLWKPNMRCRLLYLPCRPRTWGGTFFCVCVSSGPAHRVGAIFLLYCILSFLPHGVASSHLPAAGHCRHCCRYGCRCLWRALAAAV